MRGVRPYSAGGLRLSVWLGCGVLLYILLLTSSLRAQNPPSWSLGDCNRDGGIDIADAVFALNHMFLGKKPNACVPLCDTNGDSSLDISDPVALIGWLFFAKPLPGTLPSAQEFCDAIDNDCDGEIDEGCLSVSLSWDPVTTDVDGGPEMISGYTVHVGRTPRNYTQTFEAGKLTSFTLTSFNGTSLLPGVRYYLAVTSRDIAGNTSDFSAELSAVGQ